MVNDVGVEVNVEYNVFMSRRLNTGRSHNTEIAHKYLEDVINFRLMTTAACRKGIFAAILANNFCHSFCLY